ncbi:MAG TPA: endonuclease/exonuclease/phosphatase family protein [Bacteroidaceae bacterium]|nr:endonuclease/exonuclease/phosphatase family protein [Bacteroidaceae bacterium]
MAIILIVSGYSSYLLPSLFPYISLSGLAFPIFVVINFIFFVVWTLFNQKYYWISLITLLICIKPLYAYFPINFSRTYQESSENELTILSFNTDMMGLLNNFDTSTDNPIIKYISESGASIICLQESHNSMLRNLDKKDMLLPEYPYKKIIYTKQGLACFSHYPIIEAKLIPFSSFSNNGSYYFKLKIDNDTLALFNCHLQSNNLNQDEIDEYYKFIENTKNRENYNNSKKVVKKLAKSAILRAEQVDTIAAMISRESAKYILLCGDLNDTPLSYTHRIISRHLDDAHIKSGFGPGITYHKNFFYFRIDHIFSNKNLKPIKSRVDRSISVSDHYPIISVFKIQ